MHSKSISRIHKLALPMCSRIHKWKGSKIINTAKMQEFFLNLKDIIRETIYISAYDHPT